MKKVQTKHALLMSMTSLLICVSMLLGATFAWFTDSVTSGVNKIIAGNLDVELYHELADGSFEPVTQADNKLWQTAAFSGPVLWEPGAMAMETFKVVNVGNLALKYIFNVDRLVKNTSYNTVTWGGGTTEHDLTEVIKYVITDEAPATRDAAAALFTSCYTFDKDAETTIKSAALEPNASKTFTVVLYWPNNANETDNLFNLKNGVYDVTDNPTGYTLSDTSVDNALYLKPAVKLYATQYTSEYDSFDNTYDTAADGVLTYAPSTVVMSSVSAYVATSDDVTNGLILSSNDVASVEIPAANVTEGYSYAMTIETKETDTAETPITVSTGLGVTYYDIDVTEIIGDTSNSTFTEPVKITMNIGIGLIDVVAYHNGVAMTNSNNGADQTYQYDADTGILTLYSKTFSPFGITYQITVTGVSLADKSVAKGGTTTLTPVVTPTNAYNKAVTYASADTSIATVDANGVVTGVALGDTTITVTTEDGGFTDTATVTVVEPIAKKSDGSEFYGSAEDLHDALAANKSVVLLDDVDLEGYDWTPVEGYSGTFDGDEHAIKNLTVSVSGGTAAMFGSVEDGAEFTDISFVNVAISGKYAATLIGEADGKAITVSDIEVCTGTVTATNYAAGLLFDVESASVLTNLVNNADVTSDFSASGIGAWIMLSGDGHASGCENTGAVSGGNRAGGIFGNFAGTISNCTNSGDVTSTGGMPAGGIVGVLSGNSSFDHCVNTGDVSNTYGSQDANASAAGILGQRAGSQTNAFNYCINTGDVTAANSTAAGIAYGLYGGINANYCYNSGTITGNLTIGSNPKVAAGGITPDGAYGKSGSALNCVNAGTVAANTNGSTYQLAKTGTGSYYYDGDTLKTAAGADANAEEALAALNGGSDTTFWTISGGKIVPASL